MDGSSDNDDTWLQSQSLAVKHCLEAANRKKHRHQASELHSPRKKRNCKKYRSLNSLDSVFGMCVFNNPNIKDPSHPLADAIKFRRRFRVPYSLFSTIVDMFRT